MARETNDNFEFTEKKISHETNVESQAEKVKIKLKALITNNYFN